MDSTCPLISVVLTTYNRSHLLLKCVNSVLDGKYENFELIIVNDASTDDTAIVAAGISDPRVQYFELEENKGVLAARNFGFDIATGDYITILDDDDILVTDALQKVYEEFSSVHNGQAEILWFDCVDQERGEISGTMPINGRGVIKFSDYVCGMIYGDFWLVFKKNVLDGARFDERLRAHESLFWLQLHRQHEAVYVQFVACKKYREHGERLCDLEQRLKQLKPTTLAMSEFMKIFGEDLLNLCPRRYGEKLAYLGLHQMLTGNFCTGRRSVLCSLRYKLSVRYFGLYLLSFFLSDKQLLKIYISLEA